MGKKKEERLPDRRQRMNRVTESGNSPSGLSQPGTEFELNPKGSREKV